MFSPIEVQLWWGRNGAYVALFVTLTVWFAGANQTANAFLLPLCAVGSAWTVQRFVGSRSSLAHWWSVSIVRWISWAILNLLTSSFVFAFLAFTLMIFVPSPDYRFFFLIAFAPPLLILLRHIYVDCRDMRRNFGTIARGAVILHPSERKPLGKGCRV